MEKTVLVHSRRGTSWVCNFCYTLAMTINTNVEEYIKGTGQKIGRILIVGKDSRDFELEFNSIEREIYEVAICYSRIFFFETQSFLLEENAEKRLRFLVQTRFNIQQRKVEKMSNIDLVAHCIKLEVLESLKGAGLVLN